MQPRPRQPADQRRQPRARVRIAACLHFAGMARAHGGSHLADGLAQQSSERMWRRCGAVAAGEELVAAAVRAPTQRRSGLIARLRDAAAGDD